MFCRGLPRHALACFLLCHCSLGPSATEKAEAGLISRAVDVLREAPNSEKQRLFGALQRTNCAAPDLCELKRVCVLGFEQHLHALGETARARALLSTDAGQAEAGQILDGARAELSRAAAELSSCADAEGAARRRYKL